MPLYLPAVKTHGLRKRRGVHPILIHEVFDRRCFVYSDPAGGLLGFFIKIADDLAEDNLFRLPSPGGGFGITALIVNRVQGFFYAVQGFDIVLWHFGYLHVLCLYQRSLCISNFFRDHKRAGKQVGKQVGK